MGRQSAIRVRVVAEWRATQLMGAWSTAEDTELSVSSAFAAVSVCGQPEGGLSGPTESRNVPPMDRGPMLAAGWLGRHPVRRGSWR